MEKLKNLSLKRTILLYMVMALVCSFLLSAFLIQTAIITRQQITWKYVDEIQYHEMMQGDGVTYELPVPLVKREMMDATDWIVSETCDFIETYAILLLSVAGSGLAVYFFYRNKLSPPIEELREAAEMVRKEELDFHVTYENKDELGQLCREFESMRTQLEENNRTLWRMIEEEKVLREAIAHDIRSPLTVLKGYQEMLLEFVPEETFGKEQILSMLSEGMTQIERMNDFIETMRKMNSLERRDICSEAVDLSVLAQLIDHEGQIISKENGKKCNVYEDTDPLMFYGDKEIILEVVENLLSNALRYAKEEIQIKIGLSGDELIVAVSDDGKGFTESPETVTKVFYHSNPQDDLQHFGLGMYISRLYCEKHGGRLSLGNEQSGGAIVKAIFKSIK